MKSCESSGRLGYHIITIHLGPQDRVRAAALQTYVSSMQPFIDLHDLKKWLQFNKVGARCSYRLENSMRQLC